MGIDGLWKLLDPASQKHSLQELAINDGFQRRRERRFRVGVDTDALMAQCIAGAQSNGVHGPGPLRVFFFKLCRFLKSPITWIFVFDGPSRPDIKRGKKVHSLAPSWRGPAQSLIEAFGFVVQEAPGEGEAELAKLNELEIIDAVLTTDSDAFVFGAKRVIRSMTVSDRKRLGLHDEESNIYTADAIQHAENVMISPGGFIILALGLGGDYTNGVEGCGLSTAHALAQCGFGDTLLEADQTLRDEDFEGFRKKWLEEIKLELKTNSKGYLSSRQPKLASKFPDNFPDRAILDLYIRPLTSFSQSQVPPDLESWALKETQGPQISKITEFCRSHLGWRGDISEILKVFQKSLWEGIFMQLLYTKGVCFDPKNQILKSPLLHVEVMKFAQRPHAVHRVLRLNPWSRVTFSSQSFIMEVAKVIKCSPEIGGKDLCTVWVPTCTLPSTMGGPTSLRQDGVKQNLALHAYKETPRAHTVQRESLPDNVGAESLATRKRPRHEAPIAPLERQQEPVIDVYPLSAESSVERKTYLQAPTAARHEKTWEEVIDVYPSSPPPIKRRRPGKVSMPPPTKVVDVHPPHTKGMRPRRRSRLSLSLETETHLVVDMTTPPPTAGPSSTTTSPFGLTKHTGSRALEFPPTQRSTPKNRAPKGLGPSQPRSHNAQPEASGSVDDPITLSSDSEDSTGN